MIARRYNLEAEVRQELASGLTLKKRYKNGILFKTKYLLGNQSEL